MQINSKDATTLKRSCFLSTNIIKLSEDIIKYGIENKASDIHIREINKEVSLEYRINGILEKINISNILPSELIARFKVMSRLNVAEKRLPQDGSFSYIYDKNKYDIRMATLPTIYGENIVLRILNTTLNDISFKGLGFNDDKIEKIKYMLSKMYGLILVTGPTGSGKSTTLLSLVNYLNSGDKKIISIEDPVENKVEGIVQIQIKEEIGLTFEKVLRTTLRSDPDIIVISEIRDEITAEIAIRAALTGHLVLATLHTNNSVSTFTRLIDMKIPKYLILDCLIGIISQRLVRIDSKSIRLCVSEILVLDENTREIFSKNLERSVIEKKLKENSFSTIEDELERLERIYFEKNSSI